MKTRHIALLLGLCALMLTPGCIRNDIPYPVVPLEILGIEGEGFTCTVRDIDPVTHTATLQLEETTDIARVTITGITLTEGAEPSRPLTGTFDLRSPLYVTLSLYQDYDWTIRAEQTVERSFRVAQQVGETEFDLKNRIARARVPEGEVDLTDVHVTELKLGPRDITTIDPPKEELTDFTSVRYVEVSYHDVRERWSLYVTPTDVTVQLTGADAWTSVIWLSGTGLSGTEMGFRYRKAGDETWLEVPDTQIDEPVLQHSGDDLYYNSHNAYGEYYMCGAVFSQETYNDRTFDAPMTILYGHGTVLGAPGGLPQNHK